MVAIPEFDADFGLGGVPHRLTLHRERYERAWTAHCERQAALGKRPPTKEAVAASVGMPDSMIRRAVRGERPINKFQAERMAAELGCSFRDIVENIYDSGQRERDARNRQDMVAWPVPLREVASWVELVVRLKDANTVRGPAYGDDINSLTAAPTIDTFANAVRYARRILADNPACAAAMLQDAAEDLHAQGIHVLSGRYVGRRTSLTPELKGIDINMVLELHLRRTPEDLDHVVDRRGEPMTTSDDEDSWEDDEQANTFWLEWEGKPRLLFWGAGRT